METNFVPKKKPQYGLIILGNAGAGKSYICNMIIGYERFETDFRREAVTTATECHQITAESSDLLIYNVPGLIESDQEKIERNKREIIKAFEQCPISVVIFVWTQIDGRPLPDDIIAFKALKEAYKFSSKSLMFVINNTPRMRPPTFEGRFFALLTKMLNPMPISLEDMFFFDTLNSEDNDKFGATRDRLLHFIAQHHEKEQKMYADIIVQYNELCMLRRALKEQYLAAEANKQALELQIKQMTEEYEVVKKDQEKRYLDMVRQLEFAKQHVTHEEKGHELADPELEVLHQGKKPNLKKQCQQLWKEVENEKGIFKKVEKSCKIARSQLYVKCKGNEDDKKKNSTSLRPVAIGGGLGAVSVGTLGAASGGVLGAAAGGGLGAAAGAVVGGAAGVILGPCAIATAAAGAAAGTALGGAMGAVAGTALGAAGGVAIGGISGAIVTLYRFRKK